MGATVFLIVMSFMQGYGRNDWHTASIHPMPDVATCEKAGAAMVEMEKRTKFRCVTKG